MNNNNIVIKRVMSHVNIAKHFIRIYEKEIYNVVDSICYKLLQGNKILIFGNGGSAAAAQHIAGEFVNRFLFDRPAIPAIALSTDTSVMTAISNDSNYENVFSRQVESLVKLHDVCIGISTSGNSENVYNGLKTALENGSYIVTFLGNDGGKISEIEGHNFIVPSNETPRIQECHILLAHIMCELIERKMYGKT